MCFWESRRTTNDGMLTTWPRERSSHTPASRGLRPACSFWTVAGLGSLSRQESGQGLPRTSLSLATLTCSFDKQRERKTLNLIPAS